MLIVRIACGRSVGYDEIGLEGWEEYNHAHRNEALNTAFGIIYNTHSMAFELKRYTDIEHPQK
jgi:hypothetical protein